MKFKGKDVFSSGDIADKLGFKDYHKVSNYLGKIKAKYVTRKGNTRYYDRNTTEKVITYFKSLNSSSSGTSNKDKVIDELRKELREEQEADDQKLKDQKASYERLLNEKDKRIDDLKKSHDQDLETQKVSYEKLLKVTNDRITDLKDQVKTQNVQIQNWDMAQRRAQTLNLVDKDPDKVKKINSGAEKSNESSSSSKKTENQSNQPKRKTRFKPVQHWWSRFFKQE